MVAKLATLTALGGFIFLTLILVVARLQHRRVQKMLASNERQHEANLVAKNARDQKLQEDKLTLEAASVELRTAVVDASALLDQKLRETEDPFAKKRILNDKLKLLEIQRPGSEVYPKGSITALVDDFRVRTEEVRRFARRFER